MEMAHRQLNLEQQLRFDAIQRYSLIIDNQINQAISKSKTQAICVYSTIITFTVLKCCLYPSHYAPVIKCIRCEEDYHAKCMGKIIIGIQMILCVQIVKTLFENRA
eukprot:739706_1